MSLSGGWYAKPPAPSQLSANISSSGDTIIIAYSTVVRIGTGGAGGNTISMSGGAVTLTYVSGANSTLLTYSLDRTVEQGETGTISYTQPGNGIEGTRGGRDVPSFSARTVTNNSAQGGSALGLEQDWIYRNSGSGVFHYTGFETDAKVNNYRFSSGVGHDPSPSPGSTGSYVRRDPTGGILGRGCLELEQLTGGNMNSYFWFPFDSAKTTYVFDDTGYNRGPGQGFYMQVRMKTNCGGVSSTGGGGRKMFSCSLLTNSYTAQEIVYQDTLYRGIGQMYQGVGPNSAYEGFEEGSATNGFAPYAAGSDYNFQPGGDVNTLPDFCSYSSPTSPASQAACWNLHNGEWITYLLHIVPSNDNTANGSVYLYAAGPTDTDYTLIMSKDPFLMKYDSGKVFYNAALLWIYETGRTAGAANQKQWYDQLILSTNFIPCPQPLPAWFSTSLNTWFDAGSGSRLSVAQTYTEPSGAPHSGFCAYSGATVIGTRLYVAGGGHGDGGSNAIFEYDLANDSPAATLLFTPTTPVTAEALYNSGKPASRHTSWNIQGIAARNRIFFFGGWAYYGNGNTGSIKVDAFRLDTNDYEAAGTYADETGLNGTAPPMCQDTDGNVYVWRETSGQLKKWTQATGAWSELLAAGPSIIYNSPMAYDPVRNRLVLIDGSNSRYFDLTAGTMTTFSTSAARAASFFWCGDVDAFLYKAFGSTTIEQIDPVTYVKSSYAVSGTAPAEDSGGINNMYDRIGWIESLGIVYSLTQNSTNLSAFRTR